MKYYAVSYQYSANVYCANIAQAESREAVERHYSNHAWFSVKEASEGEVAAARRKGMPFVVIEPETAEAAAADWLEEINPAAIRAELEKRAQSGSEFVNQVLADTERIAAAEQTAETDAAEVISRATERVEAYKGRSAWDRGVKAYALELIGGLDEGTRSGWLDLCDIEAPNLLTRSMLNGATSWSEYSWGGCSLIYNGDIAARLCTPSELKKIRNGERRPNASEEWLDTQARALHQAAAMVRAAVAAALR